MTAAKSTKLRAIEGGRSNSLPKPEILLAKEPKYPPKFPPPPVDLDTQAKKVYKRLAKLMEKAGLGTAGDGDALAVLAQVRSRIAKVHEQMKKKKSYVGDGEVRTLVSMEKAYYSLFLTYAKQFGLTPVGRVGLTVNADTEDGEDYLR